MKKIKLLVLTGFVLCLAACAAPDKKPEEPAEETSQEASDRTEETEENKETTSEIKSVNVDIFISLFEEYSEAHPEQIEGIDLSALEGAGYKNGDVIELTGYMKRENRTSSTFSLYGTVGTDDLNDSLHYFVCYAEKPLHLLIPADTEVTVRGLLKMEEGFPWLDDCEFLTPLLDNPVYESNVSKVQGVNGEELVVTGELTSVEEILISEEERNILAEKKTPLSDAMIQMTHRGILSDGENEILVYYHNEEELHDGDKITVKGLVSQEDGILFVNAGDIVYKYE